MSSKIKKLGNTRDFSYSCIILLIPTSFRMYPPKTRSPPTKHLLQYCSDTFLLLLCVRLTLPRPQIPALSPMIMCVPTRLLFVCNSSPLSHLYVEYILSPGAYTSPSPLLFVPPFCGYPFPFNRSTCLYVFAVSPYCTVLLQGS